MALPEMKENHFCDVKCENVYFRKTFSESASTNGLRNTNETLLKAVKLHRLLS